MGRWLLMTVLNLSYPTNANWKSSWHWSLTLLMKVYTDDSKDCSVATEMLLWIYSIQKNSNCYLGDWMYDTYLECQVPHYWFQLLNHWHWFEYFALKQGHYHFRFVIPIWSYCHYQTLSSILEIPAFNRTRIDPKHSFTC